MKRMDLFPSLILGQTRGRQFPIHHCILQTTHTDQYLQWDSHHNLSTKYSVIGTLTHRPKTVCTGPELLKEELECLKVECKYPRWAIQKVQNKYINSNWEDGNNNNCENSKQDTHRSSNSFEEPPREKANSGHIVIPYIQGLGESIKKIC